MATNRRIEIIEKDRINALEKAINDFFVSAGGFILDVLISVEPLFNGNKIYVAVIVYDIGIPPSNPGVKLFEKDSPIALQKEMNDFIIAFGSDPSLIRNQEVIMKQGNNSYIGLVGYKIGASGGDDEWKDAGIFTFDDWQPNATNTGSIPFVLNLNSKEIITDVLINLITPFGGGGILTANMFIDSSAFPAVSIAGAFGLFVSPPTSQFRPGVNQLFDGANYDMNGRIVLGGGVIDDLTAGEIQVFYKTTFQP